MKGTLTAILMIGGALAAGSAAAYFAKDYIDSAVSERRTELEAQYQLRGVVVANADLQPGALLSARTVAVREVPKAFLHAEAVPAEDWSGIAGRVVARAVRSGEPILMSHLAQEAGAGFSSQLAEGMRALTLPVDEEASISGLLSPGDRIDIFFTTTSNNEALTVPLLLNVPVIATGVRTTTNESHLPARQQSGPYRTVTVSVTPQNAAKVTLAQDAGKLTIALRQAQDHASIHIARITKKTLLTGDRVLNDAAPRRRVEIILGGT